MCPDVRGKTVILLTPAMAGGPKFKGHGVTQAQRSRQSLQHTVGSRHAKRGMVLAISSREIQRQMAPTHHPPTGRCHAEATPSSTPTRRVAPLAFGDASPTSRSRPCDRHGGCGPRVCGAHDRPTSSPPHLPLHSARRVTYPTWTKRRRRARRRAFGEASFDP